MNIRLSGSVAVRCVLLAVLCLARCVVAQDVDETATGTDDNPTEIIETDQTVEVDAAAPDDEIGKRLIDILEATDRFAAPIVEVRDGVVFLSGTTQVESNREWAGNLARRTEGVVAVVNNIEVDRGPIWTLQPAENELRELWREFVHSLPMVLVGLIILIVTLFAAKFIAGISNRQLMRRVESTLVRNVAQKLIFVAVLLVGLYLFLRISGLTRIAMTLAGGTGILGLIVGFAFRDIAENFLASVLISVQRPFRIGDTIEIDGHLGIVQKVTTRGTVLMDFDGNHIQITNATVYKNVIRNYTANPKIRIGFVIGIGYDSSITLAQQVGIDVLTDHPAVLSDPEPSALIEELGSASINVHIYAWIDGNEYSRFKVRSSLMRQVIRAYEDAGISLPDEAREVIFPQGVQVRMLDDALEKEAGEATAAATPDVGKRRDEPEEEEDLVSEVAEIQRQADRSRVPEEGSDILAEDNTARAGK